MKLKWMENWRHGVALVLVLAVTLTSCSDEHGSKVEAKKTPKTSQDPVRGLGVATIAHSSWLSARADDLNTGISNSSKDAVLGQVAWTWDAAGRLWPGPVAKDGVLYVGDGNLEFYAIRVADGKQLWRSRPRLLKTLATDTVKPNENFAKRAEPKDLDDHYGYSMPVLDKDQVITISEYGVMTSFALSDGKVKWEYDFDAKVMSSPRVHGNRLFVNCTDGNFFAFNKNNGKEIWRYWTSAKMLGSSCAFLGPTTAIFPAHDRFLHIVDLKIGKATNRYPISHVSASTPLIAFGCAYFTATGGLFCCFDLVEEEMRWTKKVTKAASHSLALSGDNILVHARNELHAYHGVTGDLVWKTKLAGQGAIAPCVGPNLIYMSCDKAVVYAIDPQDGTIKWQQKFGDGSRFQPVLIDGLVVVGNFKGRLTAFK